MSTITVDKNVKAEQRGLRQIIPQDGQVVALPLC
jgi:hypothetical protein